MLIWYFGIDVKLEMLWFLFVIYFDVIIFCSDIFNNVIIGLIFEGMGDMVSLRFL